MIDWMTEWPLIRDASIVYGVDPFYVAAIRTAENGGPGREFGVLSVNAPTYADQLHECCLSVRNRMHGAPVMYANRLIYDARDILDFSRRWCPIGVANDGTELNQYWFHNVWSAYTKYSLAGKVA